MSRLHPWHARTRRDRPRTDYAGAVYGSLLAASVLATAGAVGEFPRLQTVVMLLVTGLVFWAAHVYAKLAGERSVDRPVGWPEVRRVGRDEWAIVEAAVLPSLVVLVSGAFGVSLATSGWLALGTAVAQQVGWAYLGALHANASRNRAAVEAAVNLVLGLVIVAAKAAISH